MPVVLIRHTKPLIANGICYGQTDIMTNAGDIPVVVEKVAHLKNPIVYSSPLRRCLILAENLSENEQIDHRLKELNFGQWEMKPWNEIVGKEAELWFANFVYTPCPDGESFHDLYLRAVSFFNEKLKTTTNDTIVVTHAGVIRALHAHVNNIPLEKSFDLKVDFGEVITLIP